MNTVRRIVKNSGASLLSQISTPASSFILVFSIARIMGVAGLGKFAAVLSLFIIFQGLSSLGFSHLITREVAQDKLKAGKFLVNASFLVGIFSLFMVFAMCIVINLITDVVDIVNGVYVLSIALIPSSLTMVCQSICRAFEKLEYNAMSQIAGNVAKVIIGLFVLFNGYGFIPLMFAVLGSHILTFIFSQYFALKCIPNQQYKLNLSFCKWIIRAAPIFALIIILNSVRWNIDTLILTNMIGEIEVGFYSAAYKIMTLCKLALSCYIVAIQPVIFRLFKSSIENFIIVCNDSIRYLFLLTIPIAVGICLLRNQFVILIFKDSFLPATDVLVIIIWMLVLSGANLIFANVLIASNNQKINFKANMFSTIANVCLNLLLIPKIGFIGAGIASITSSIILFIYQYSFISRHLFRMDFVNLMKKPIVSGLFMGLGIILMKDINLFIVICVSIAVYILSLFILRTFSSKDMDLFRQLWKGKSDFVTTKN